MRAVTIAIIIAVSASSATRAADLAAQPTVIQSIELSANRAYYIPTHSRVTTTIRFPAEMGAPEGAVGIFTEDAAKQPAEYLVTWQQSDSYFTVTPLRDSQLANLNVPYGGQTFVFYFYPVADPLKAVACVNLIAGPSATSSNTDRPAETLANVARQSTPPTHSAVAVNGARLLGLIDRLKLIHATPPGPRLAALAQAMHVELAPNCDARGGETDQNASRLGAGGTNDAGLFQIILLRAVRDPRLNCVGFICLVRNVSDEVLTFDVNSFGARAGSEYLPQRISDATVMLKPGEQSPAYFVVTPPTSSPLRAENDWRISVDLVSPRINPGAVISRTFSRATTPP